jgi:hypothetical protein
MKIFKFLSVDAKTGISVEIERPKEGPTKPNLPEMGEVFYFGGWRYATVGNAAKANPENYIHEITQADFDDVIAAEFANFKAARIEDAYKEEKDIRGALFGKYHDSAAVAGVYKYEQAKALLADPTADAPEVEAEATARGVDVAIIAQRIVDNHEAFRLTEAKLAGLRGKIVDRLNGLTFDATDALGSWKELVERKEVIGTYPESPGGPDAPAGGARPEGSDVEVGYYIPNLSQRWEWLNKG